MYICIHTFSKERVRHCNTPHHTATHRNKPLVVTIFRGGGNLPFFQKCAACTRSMLRSTTLPRRTPDLWNV